MAVDIVVAASTTAVLLLLLLSWVAHVWVDIVVAASTTAVLLLLLLSWVAHVWVERRRLKLPPGPLPLPILGNLLLLLLLGGGGGGGRHRLFARLARRYGPAALLRLGPSTRLLLVSSPSLARHILHTHDKTFSTRPPFLNALLLMGDPHGDQPLTFLPLSDHWRQTRKLYIAHLFSPRRIDRFHSTIIPLELRRLLHSHLLPACDVGHVVDLTACTDLLVENLICRIVTGRPSRAGPFHAGSSVAELVREFTALLGAPLVGEFIPCLGFLDHKTRASFTKWKAKFDDVMDHILAEHEKERSVAEKEDLDSGDIILDAFMSPESGFNKDVIKAMLMELFAAGSDTMSAAIDWGMSELLGNPRVMGKLRDELNTVMGTRERQQQVGISDLPRLPYLGAVVRETLRMHPTAPLMMPHMALDDCQLDAADGGYVIRKGTRVLVNAWAIGHDPEVWKGIDPEVFAPERFLEESARKGHMDARGQQFEFLAFGSGRRMCPGVDLALPTVAVVIGNLVHAFDEWELVLPHGQRSPDMSDECGIILRRVHPLLTRPRRRRPWYQ